MFSKNELKSKLAQQALSGVRLGIHIKQSLEHIFFPPEVEKNTSLLDRAQHQIDKHGVEMLNDLTLPLK